MSVTGSSSYDIPVRMQTRSIPSSFSKGIPILAMQRVLMQVSRHFVAGAILVLMLGGAARADTLSGVITSYESGNAGTDMYVRTADGHKHRLWFDNMKKPLFQGKALPWCPDWPCTGWPAQLVLNKTRVTIS